MWEFLSDPDNQSTIAFYAAGVAAVAAGLWKAFVALRKKPGTGKPTPRAQQVQGGDGVTAGGDMMIEGGVHVTRNEVPKWAIGLMLAGVVLIAAGAYFSVGGDHMENSIKTGGDINADTITIGTPSQGSE